MNFTDYSRLDKINWSTLKHMRKSPLHFQHARNVPPEDKTRFARGRAAHTAVFEPERFLIDYALFKGKTRRGKEWDAFCEQHADQTILKIDEYRDAIAIRDAVRGNAQARVYLDGGHPEHTIEWQDAVTRLECKGRPDFVSASSPAIVDLKTTGDVSALRFGAVSARLGYHTQLAFYRDGYEALTGLRLPVVIIAVEMEAPHDVAVYRVDEEALYAGTEEYRSLLWKVSECTTSGHWPGRFSAEQPLHLPPWAYGDDDGASDLDLIISKPPQLDEAADA